jgi:hypothetical protein
MAFNNTSELPDSQIEYRDNDGGRRLVTLIIYIVLALVVATLVVFAGRWVYHKVSNNSGPAPTTVSPQSINQGNKTTTPSPASKTPSMASTPPPSSYTTPPPSPTPNKSTSPSPSSSSTKKTAGTTAPSTTPTPTSLPNNGPGEIIAIFIGTSFMAALLHFTTALFRSSKNL